MKKTILVLSLVLFLCLFSGFVKAEDYAGKQVLSSDYESPKLACKNGNDCLLVAYKNTNEIYLFHTTNMFENINNTIKLADYTPNSAIKRNTFSFSYDVYYSNNGYLISHGRNMYYYNLSTNSLNSSYFTTLPNTCRYVGIFNDTYAFALCISTTDDNVSLWWANSGGLVSRIGNITSLGSYCADNTLDDVQGFFANLNTVNSISDVIMDLRIARGGSCSGTFSVTRMSGFPDSYDGLFEYINNRIFYRNTTSVKYVLTGDFVSYNSITPYYYFGKNVTQEDRVYLTGDYYYVVYKVNGGNVYFWNTFTYPPYEPAIEYVNGTRIAYNWWQWLFGWSYYSPRIACDPDMQECLLIYYDNTPIFGGIGYIYTTDGFNTITASGNLGVPLGDAYGYNAMITDSNTQFVPMPFDVAYDTEQNRFLIAVTYFHATGVYVYEWTLHGGLKSLWSIPSTDIDEDINLVLNFKKETKISQNPILCYLKFEYYNIVWTQVYYFCVDKNHNVISGHQITSVHKTCNRNIFGGGFITDDEKFYIRTNFYNKNDLIPTDNTGIQYYSENDLVYTRQYNSSINVYEGIYKTETSDFTSYTPVTPYYIFNKSINEIIPRTDRILLKANRLYAYEKQAVTDYGIYIYKEPLTILNLETAYLKPQYNSYLGFANASFILQCNNRTTYGETLFGAGEMYTTCDIFNMTVIPTSDLVPAYSSNLIEKYGSCGNYMTLYYKFIPKSYDVTFYVLDSIFNIPIQNATIRIDNNYYYTDSSGKATVHITNPVLSPRFIGIQESGGCSYRFEITGTKPNTYYVKVTHPIYDTYINETYAFADVKQENSINYFDFKSKLTNYIQLDPKGVLLTVKLKTLDGIEIQPKNDIVRVENVSQVYVYEGNTYYNQTSTTTIPATFLLIDNRTVFTATVILEHGTNVYTKEINLTQETGEYTLWFILNETADLQSCTDNLDCLGGFCKGNVFYKLIGCIQGQCRYDKQVCTLCDDDIGCYDLKGYESILIVKKNAFQKQKQSMVTVVVMEYVNINMLFVPHHLVV